MLESLGPLTAQERACTLADFDRAPGLRLRLATLAHAVKARRGLILLHGNNGVGKSRLRIATANGVRPTQPAIYAPAARILACLRAGFNPNRPHAAPPTTSAGRPSRTPSCSPSTSWRSTTPPTGPPAKCFKSREIVGRRMPGASAHSSRPQSRP